MKRESITPWGKPLESFFPEVFLSGETIFGDNLESTTHLGAFSGGPEVFPGVFS